MIPKLLLNFKIPSILPCHYQLMSNKEHEIKLIKGNMKKTVHFNDSILIMPCQRTLQLNKWSLQKILVQLILIS